MKLNKLVDKAKKTIDQRGGMDALKADAEELKSIAKGKGSLKDKAKAATEAIKDPGAKAVPEPTTTEPPADSEPSSSTPAPE